MYIFICKKTNKKKGKRGKRKAQEVPVIGQFSKKKHHIQPLIP